MPDDGWPMTGDRGRRTERLGNNRVPQLERAGRQKTRWRGHPARVAAQAEIGVAGETPAPQCGLTGVDAALRDFFPTPED